MNTHPIRGTLTQILAVLCVLVCTGLAHAQEADGHTAKTPASENRWYVVELQGQRSGWVHSTQKTAEGKITSSTTMKLEIKRGTMGVSLRFDTDFVETTAGEPVSMRVVQQLGAIPMETRYTFGEHELAIETRQGKADWTRTTSPLPEGKWLCPAEASRFIDEQIEAGKTEISLRTIDPTTGVTPFGVKMELVGRENVETLGKVVPAMKWSISNDRFPSIVSTEYTDLSGVSVRSTTSIGGLSLTVLLADKSLALAKADPPELLVSTMVTPDRPIREPRGLKRAVYVVRATREKLPDLPDTGPQRFERIDESSCRLTIDVEHPSPADKGDATDRRFIEASVMLDSEDKEVQALTAKALKDVPADAAALTKAETLRTFVHEYIEEKTLGVGFATASEVARTAAGDCTEHGVLLAAMLRAAGVPSRVVAGLLYVDEFEGARNVFGYHMWTQALVEIDGRPAWIDVDAVLPGGGGGLRSDATHIALAVTPLDSPEVQNSLVELAPLLGGLEIKVEEPEPTDVEPSH